MHFSAIVAVLLASAHAAPIFPKNLDSVRDFFNVARVGLDEAEHFPTAWTLRGITAVAGTGALGVGATGYAIGNSHEKSEVAEVATVPVPAI